MRKIVILSTLLAITTAMFLGLVIYRKITKSSFTIEWHEITQQTRPSMRPILEKLQSVEVEAFVPLVKPYVYATDPRVTSIPDKQKSFAEQKIVSSITESLRSGLSKEIDQLYIDLQDKNITAAYVAIAKNNQQNIIGFSLFKESPVKDVADSQLLSIVEGSYEQIYSTNSARDEVYVSNLAVVPEIQKKGLGKALLFSVFEHCAHIKKIYLTTSASDFNKNARAFYEHIGFTKVLKGIFVEDKYGSDFGKEKMVYVYQKKQSTNQTPCLAKSLACPIALQHF